MHYDYVLNRIMIMTRTFNGYVRMYTHGFIRMYIMLYTHMIQFYDIQISSMYVRTCYMVLLYLNMVFPS